MNWFKYAAVAVAAALIFGAGYKYASAIYKEDIAQIRAQHALATKELTDEYRSKEQNQAQQLADAWDQLERARAESVDLRADVDRVRKLADNYRSRLSAAAPIPATLSESDLPAAQNFSKKVQNYLLRVQGFLKE